MWYVKQCFVIYLSLVIHDTSVTNTTSYRLYDYGPYVSKDTAIPSSPVPSGKQSGNQRQWPFHLQFTIHVHIFISLYAKWPLCDTAVFRNLWNNHHKTLRYSSNRLNIVNIIYLGLTEDRLGGRKSMACYT